MPVPEWEPHRATWIAWPHHEPDWPGKLGAIPWVYAEIARVLAAHEPVEDPLPRSPDVLEPRRRLALARARRARWIASGCTSCPTDRVWLRDSAPTGVHRRHGPRRARELGVQRLGEVRQLAARRARRRRDRAAITGLPRVEPRRPDRRADRARRRRHRGQRRRACCSSPKNGC